MECSDRPVRTPTLTRRRFAFADVLALGDTMIRNVWASAGTAREILNDYTRQAQERLDEALRG